VDANFCADPARGVAEATSILPQILEVQLPKETKPGDLTEVKGPHGAVEVEAPADFKPGKKVRLHLGAPPEMRIQVPKSGKPGDPLQIIRVDKIKISVRIPQGLKDGDYFNVAAPVLIVAVPEHLRPGDCVVFKDPTPGKNQWLEAQCPKELLYGRYFAACVPLPAKKAAK
jgi:hypothetical protein